MSFSKEKPNGTSDGLAGTWPAKESGPMARLRLLWSREVALKGENKKIKAENSLPAPTPEEIAVCAYHLYERRGRQPGHELADWLQAEEILNPSVRDGTYNELVTAIKEEGANPWEHATRVGTPMTNHLKS